MVAPTTHFRMKARPNTLGASFTHMHGNNVHDLYICHQFSLETTRHSKQLEKWGGVLLGLGCLFLFSGILFLDPQNPFLSGFLRISFFLISFFLIFSEEFLHRNVVLEGSWWRVLENACFQPLSEDFFARIPAGQKFLYLHRIPPDSSGFLWIPPDSCSRQNLSGLDQQLKKTLC